MSKIKNAFQNGKAFIPFVTCGDPNLETTEQLIRAMEKSGADLIELGIPFSDPTAEGPVIQGANLRALSGGVTTDRIFEMVRRLRRDVKIPLVFMTYANVVFSYGTERFAQKAAEVGMDGIILPDVPFEEKEEFAPVFRKYGMDFISLIAPTSSDRVTKIAAEAEGFVYCVSSLGVTGVRKDITTDIGAMVKLVRETNPEIPCAIGFGISTPEQAKKMAQHADGVIVGSAIVRQIGELGEESQLYKLGNSLLENSEVAEPTGFEYFGGSVEMSGQVPGVVGIAAHCDDLASQFLITSENSGAGMEIPKTAYDAAGIQLQSLFFFQQKLQNPVQNIAVFLVGVLPVL